MFEKTNRILAFVAVTLTILGIFYTPLYYSEESYGQGDVVQYNQGWVWEKGNEDIPVDLRNPIKTMDHQVVIKRNLDHFMSYNGGIGFFTSDMHVRVYIDNLMVYCSGQSRGQSSKLASGNVWHYVNFEDYGSPGDSIRIVYTKNYCNLMNSLNRKYQISENFGSIGREYHNHQVDYIQPSSIFVSDRYDFYSYLLVKSTLQLAVAFLILVLGIGTILFANLVHYKAKEKGYLSYLGLSIAFAGIATMASSGPARLLYQNSYLLSETISMSMLLAVLSYSMALIKETESNNIRSQTTNKQVAVLASVWQGVAGAMIVLRLGGMVYQPLMVFNMVMLTNMTMNLIILLLVLPTTVLILREKNASKSVTFSIMMILLLPFLDYAFKDLRIYHMVYFKTVGMMIFFSLVVINEISIYVKLYEASKEKEFYKDLAGRDKASDLLNRMAFRENLPLYEKKLEDLTVVIMDVNHLKLVNDRMGHLAGDNLIKFCADLIKEYLGDLGDCYRTGGDEFMMVIEHADKALIAQRIEKIEAAVAGLDRYKSFKIGMATGMTSAKIPSDKTMADVIKRADKIMYQKKKEMKEEEDRKRFLTGFES